MKQRVTGLFLVVAQQCTRSINRLVVHVQHCTRSVNRLVVHAQQLHNNAQEVLTELLCRIKSINLRVTDSFLGAAQQRTRSKTMNWHMHNNYPLSVREVSAVRNSCAANGGGKELFGNSEQLKSETRK